MGTESRVQGSVECLVWLQQRGMICCAFSVDTVAEAAYEGNTQ